MLRSSYRTLGSQTARAIALLCLADGVVGASFGAVAAAAGLPLWVPMVLSLAVFGGSAQFVFVGLIASGGSPVGAAVAALLVNLRLFPLALAADDALGSRPLHRVFGTHLVTDETVAFALSRDDAHGRRVVFWWCGVPLFVVWNLSVLAGALAGAALGGPEAFGLDAAFPAVLLALLVPMLDSRARTRVAGLGAGLALAATPLLAPGLPVLVGLAGAVGAAHRRRRATGAPDAAGGTR